MNKIACLILKNHRLYTTCCKVAPIMYRSTNRIICSKCGEKVGGFNQGGDQQFNPKEWPSYCIQSPAEAAANRKQGATRGAAEVKPKKALKPLKGQKALL